MKTAMFHEIALNAEYDGYMYFNTGLFEKNRRHIAQVSVISQIKNDNVYLTAEAILTDTPYKHILASTPLCVKIPINASVLLKEERDAQVSELALAHQ